jgi:hypothetical protein
MVRAQPSDGLLFTKFRVFWYPIVLAFGWWGMVVKGTNPTLIKPNVPESNAGPNRRPARGLMYPLAR